MSPPVVLVIGRTGQLARSLTTAQAPGLTVQTCGRPQLDLTRPDSLEAAVDAYHPALVVNAAAYTAVDAAETEPEAAFALNRDGAAHLARACAQRDIPLIQLSTDYVFDGQSAEPYRETDPPRPLGVYGASKLDGERAVTNAWAKSVVLRTAWVYSPFGKNFLKTMLNLARTRDRLNVVADQRGTPSYGPDLAAAILTIAGRLLERPSPACFGVFHLTASGETHWAGFAREIFAQSAARGGPSAEVHPIPSASYPTPAQRPANSRLNCDKVDTVFGVRRRPWRAGVADCLAALHAAKADDAGGS